MVEGKDNGRSQRWLDLWLDSIDTFNALHEIHYADRGSASAIIRP